MGCIPVSEETTMNMQVLYFYYFNATPVINTESAIALFDPTSSSLHGRTRYQFDEFPYQWLGEYIVDGAILGELS